MSAEHLNQLAALSCIFLIIWEIIRKRYAGAFLSFLALIPLTMVAEKVYLVFTIVLTLPVLFEERWHNRSRKDLIRAVLAGTVIACSTAMLLIFVR